MGQEVELRGMSVVEEQYIRFLCLFLEGWRRTVLARSRACSWSTRVQGGLRPDVGSQVVQTCLPLATSADVQSLVLTEGRQHGGNPGGVLRCPLRYEDWGNCAA